MDVRKSKIPLLIETSTSPTFFLAEMNTTNVPRQDALSSCSASGIQFLQPAGICSPPHLTCRKERVCRRVTTS